uniref:C-type lectin domain-containing protein n=1 Tax=Acrobeloides nanus TaxID=290746 RepID=A0A914CKM3_9BILA
MSAGTWSKTIISSLAPRKTCGKHVQTNQLLLALAEMNMNFLVGTAAYFTWGAVQEIQYFLANNNPSVYTYEFDWADNINDSPNPLASWGYNGYPTSDANANCVVLNANDGTWTNQACSSNSETTFNGGPFGSSIAPISDLPDTKTSVNERVQDPSTLGSGQPVTTLNGRETGGSTAQIDEATGSGTNTNEEYSIATLESSTILPF